MNQKNSRNDVIYAESDMLGWEFPNDIIHAKCVWEFPNYSHSAWRGSCKLSAQVLTSICMLHACSRVLEQRFEAVILSLFNKFELIVNGTPRAAF